MQFIPQSHPQQDLQKFKHKIPFGRILLRLGIPTRLEDTDLAKVLIRTSWIERTTSTLKLVYVSVVA